MKTISRSMGIKRQMIFQKMTCLTAILLFYAIQVIYCTTTDDDLVLYNPKPILTLSTNIYGANLIKAVQSRNQLYYFMAFESDKIIVLNNQDKSYRLVDSYLCNAIDIVERTNYIYSPTSDGLMIWTMNSANKIDIFTIWKGSYTIDLIMVDDDEQAGIGIAQGLILILNLSSKQFIRVDEVFGTVATTSMSFFLFNDRFLFITNVQMDTYLYDIGDRKNSYQVLMKQRDIDQALSVVLREDNSQIFAFFITKYYGVNIYNFNFLYQISPQTKCNLVDNLIGSIQLSLVFNCISLSNDGKQIFIGSRTSGIYLYDISTVDKLSNPAFLQLLPSNGLGNSIVLSSPSSVSQEIYYSDGSQFSIFESLNQSQVVDSQKHYLINTFNQKEQCIEHTIFQDIWTWKLEYLYDGKYIAISAGEDGMKLIDMTLDYLNPILIYTYKMPGYVSHDGTLFLNKRNILVVGHSQTGFSLLDVSDIYNIKYLSTFSFPYDVDCDGFDADQATQTKLLIAAGSAGIILMDISDPFNIKILNLLYIPNRLQRNGTEMVSANVEFSYAFGCIREQGAFYFSINPYTYAMILIEFYSTFGAEFIWFDVSSYNYLFVADGSRGLTIIDVQDKQKPFVLSNVQVGGWGEKFYQSRLDPNLVIISHSVIGSASVIDVTDKQNPFIQSKIKYDNDSSYASIIEKNHTYLIITKNSGFRVCNLSHPIKIVIQSLKKEILQSSLKAQIEQLTKESTTNKILFFDSEYEWISFDPLKEMVYIHQELQFSLILLITNRNARIGQTFFICQGQTQPIPNWIIFKPLSQEFTVNVPSDALTYNNDGINYILVEIQTQIMQSDFIYPQLNINQDESLQIYNKLVSVFYIDQNGFLKVSFADVNIESFYLDWYDNNTFIKTKYNDSQVQAIIFRQLKFSVYVEPIYFRVQNQNAFNVNYIQESSYFIQLYSKYITVQISLVNLNNDSNAEELIFVQPQLLQSFSLIIDFSSQILKLHGETEMINQALYSQKIQIVNKQIQSESSNLTNSVVNILVIDNQDTTYQQQFYMSDIPFIVIRQLPLAKVSMQSLIDLQLPNDGVRQGDIVKLMIKPNEAFQFDTPTNTISFKCFFNDGKKQEERIECEELDWVGIDYKSQIMRIETHNWQYQQKIQFIIRASDGYYEIEDTFAIEINVLPLIFQILLSISLSFGLCLVFLAFFFNKRIYRVLYSHHFSYFPFQVNQMSHIRHYLHFTQPRPYLQALNLYKGLMKLRTSTNAKNQYKFPLKYFSENSDDELKYEQLQEDIQRLKKKYIKEYHDIKNCEINKRSSPTIKYLVSLLAKKYYEISDIESFKIYRKVKKVLKNEFPYVDWYQPILSKQKDNQDYQNGDQQIKRKIVTFDDDDEDEEENNLMNILSKHAIDLDKLQKVIQFNMIKNTGKISNQINECNYNFDLISECLRLDILGVDEKNTPNSKKCSFGEFIFVDQYDIQTVLLERSRKSVNNSYFFKQDDIPKEYIFTKIYKQIKKIIFGDEFQIVGCSRIWGVIDDKRSWISINQTIENQMIVCINPKAINKDGEYRLVFHNQDGYVCYQQTFILNKQIDFSININGNNLKKEQKNISTHLKQTIPSPKYNLSQNPLSQSQLSSFTKSPTNQLIHFFPNANPSRVLPSAKINTSLSESQLIKYQHNASKFKYNYNESKRIHEDEEENEYKNS